MKKVTRFALALALVATVFACGDDTMANLLRDAAQELDGSAQAQPDAGPRQPIAEVECEPYTSSRIGTRTEYIQTQWWATFPRPSGDLFVATLCGLESKGRPDRGQIGCPSNETCENEIPQHLDCITVAEVEFDADKIMVPCGSGELRREDDSIIEDQHFYRRTARLFGI